MTRSFAQAILIACLSTVTAGSASAALLYQPASATVVQGGELAGSPITNAIDQSGLSVGYDSGVTTVQSYLATTHDSSTPATTFYGVSNFDGIANGGEELPVVDFNLGQVLTLDGLLFFGFGDNDPANVSSFNLSVSTTGEFTGEETAVGNFTVDTNDNDSTPDFVFTPGQLFSFAAVDGQFVRLEVTSNFGGGDNVGGFGEVAFSALPGAAVPEPTSMALLGAVALSTGGAALRRRLRRA